MKMCNIKKRPHIFKNSKLITTIYTNDENLFYFIILMKDRDYSMSNIDLKLWHDRLGHYCNQNLQKIL